MCLGPRFPSLLLLDWGPPSTLPVQPKTEGPCWKHRNDHSTWAGCWGLSPAQQQKVLHWTEQGTEAGREHPTPRVPPCLCLPRATSFQPPQDRTWGAVIFPFNWMGRTEAEGPLRVCERGLWSFRLGFGGRQQIYRERRESLGAALHTSEGPGTQPRKVTLPAAQHVSSHTTLLQVPSLLHEVSRALKPLSSQ